MSSSSSPPDAATPDWPAIAQLVLHMAKSGEGTEECMKAGCLPLPIHYYSPVPSLEDLEQRQIWTKKSPLSGIDMRDAQQIELLRNLSAKYAHECNWPHQPNPTAAPTDFYIKNESFSYICGASTHYLVRHFKPRRVIEIGSGFSSRILSAALTLNKKDDEGSSSDAEVEYTVIDPHQLALTATLPSVTSVVTQRVECIDPSIFSELSINDILFIDSGHTVRAGSDVNTLILDILPLLQRGVIVHFHDINLPYEYPETYFRNPSFRVLWTETYLLQAFLAFNSEFEVMLALCHCYHDHREEFSKAFPYYKDGMAGSGSFWIRRKV